MFFAHMHIVAHPTESLALPTQQGRQAFTPLTKKLPWCDGKNTLHRPQLLLLTPVI
jgi:hypothetical protein